LIVVIAIGYLRCGRVRYHNERIQSIFQNNCILWRPALHFRVAGVEDHNIIPIFGYSHDLNHGAGLQRTHDPIGGAGAFCTGYGELDPANARIRNNGAVARVVIQVA
jgi:hypothetical protein